MSVVVAQLESSPGAATAAQRSSGPLPPLPADLLQARLLEASPQELLADGGGEPSATHHLGTPAIHSSANAAAGRVRGCCPYSWAQAL